MNKEQLFSVLIANYNNGKYLMDAIESVRKQIYKNWEIIIVDDCSTDNSYELYKELENESRIHIYYNSINKGCGYTKRRCAELAKGEICGFLDPDDALTPNALQVMANEHYLRPDIGLIYSRSYITDNNLNIVGITEYFHPNNKKLSYLEYPEMGVFTFASYKIKYYQQSGGIDAFMQRAVDHELYLRLDDVSKFYYVDVPLYYYRKYTGNNISLGSNAYKAAWWDSIIKYEACKRRGLNPEIYAWNVIERVLKEVKSISSQESADEVRNSITYRIGAILIGPFKRIKSLFKARL